MKGIAVSVVIALIVAVLAIAVLASIFLLGIQLSPLDARRIFSEGCAQYCTDISDQAAATSQPIGIAAVDKGNSLEGSTFIRACNFLYPETTGYPYLCWLHDCCNFELRPP